MAIQEELNGHIVKMQATVLPNVMQDSLTHLQEFTTQITADNEWLFKFLVKQPLEELKKLHSTSLNKNAGWKVATLAKSIFKATYNSSNVITSRTKVCQEAFDASVALLYAQNYYKDGAYQQTAFTDHVVLAIEKAGEVKGKIAGRAEADAAAATPDATM